MIEIAYWKMRCLVGGIRVLLEYADAGKIFTDCSGPELQAFIGFLKPKLKQKVKPEQRLERDTL